jgi:hypothetical protein
MMEADPEFVCEAVECVRESSIARRGAASVDVILSGRNS